MDVLVLRQRIHRTSCSISTASSWFFHDWRSLGRTPESAVEILAHLPVGAVLIGTIEYSSILFLGILLACYLLSKRLMLVWAHLSDSAAVSRRMLQGRVEQLGTWENKWNRYKDTNPITASHFSRSSNSVRVVFEDLTLNKGCDRCGANTPRPKEK